MREISNLKLRGYDKKTLGVIFYLSFVTLSLLQSIKKKPKSNMTLETLNDYKFNLCVFIIIFIDYVTSMFNRLNQCQKPSPPNAV